MAFVLPGPARQRIARVQIERHVERLDRAPERPVLRQVVIGHVVRRCDLREAVDQRADQAELLDAAGELGSGGFRVLHRQRGKSGEAIGALAHFGGQRVVGLLGHRDRPLDVVDRLHRRRVQRQDHHLDAVPVHFAQAHVLDVEQARTEIVPHMRAEHLRIAERRFDGDVFLERDLALHCVSPRGFSGIMQWRGGGCQQRCAEIKKPPRWAACRAVAREASEGWWSQAGSNRRPRECHSRALPSELWPQFANLLTAFLGNACGARSVRSPLPSRWSRR